MERTWCWHECGGPAASAGLHGAVLSARCHLVSALRAVQSQWLSSWAQIPGKIWRRGKPNNQLPALPSLPSTLLFNSVAVEMWFRAWRCAADPAWRRWHCLLEAGAEGRAGKKVPEPRVLKWGTAWVHCAGMSHSCTATPALTGNSTTVLPCCSGNCFWAA